jgi:glycerophosphoryl diester phosphodiesterase
MKRFVRIVRNVLIALLLFAGFCYLNNSSWLYGSEPGRPPLLAHRGLAQTYSPAGVGRDTCTANRIHPPEHEYLENTLTSMRAAIAAGADMVELDIHPTTDGQFAIFHDWTLECRTEGKGVTREHTLAQLKALDIGYGYTADGGKSFPFRGKGAGLMPSLDEVLAAFPDKRLLINIKSNDPAEGEKLVARLIQLPASAQKLLAVYGGHRPVSVVRARMPHIMTMSPQMLKDCLVTYLAIGWSGYVPASCASTLLVIPRNYAPLLWGWPDRFADRMQRVSSEVFVLGNLTGGEANSGIDTAEDFARVPHRKKIGIWTNRVDRLAPLAAAVK